MKVLVLGGGVIGVTAAYYLARAGHEVEVVENCSGVAQEASFANAGQISPGYASPWAGPDIPLKAMRWLLMRHGPLVIRPALEIPRWKWAWEFLRNCTATRYAANKGLMQPLARYSRDCLQALRADTGIAYDERSLGTLQLFRTLRQLEDVNNDIAVLSRLGIAFELLDKLGCIKAEPGLAHATAEITGGLRLPDDETGDCRQFSERLARAAEELGVRFIYRTKIRRIICEGSRVHSVITSQGIMTSDAYVVALGCRSAAMVRPLGLNIPVYPVKGYSLTIPVERTDAAPISTVMDETYKTAITRLGDRIRVGGTAELAGYDLKLRPGRRRALEHSTRSLFPGAGNLDRASFWCGLRPMTPDGPPIIGGTPIKGLYLNTGHGTLGWTMACGSGRLISDIVGGRRPEIDISGLGMDRYASS